MVDVVLNSSDGHEFGAYRADPSGAVRGGIVVVQEIFGVNTHIRSICDRLAGLGYVAIAPAIFDRVERNFQCGYSPEEVEVARKFMPDADWVGFVRDVEAARAAIADVGKVGIVGFCLGGSVAFMAATRLAGLSAACCFYGARIAEFAHETPRCPTQMHYGALDQGISMSAVDHVAELRDDCDVYVYEGAGHGFHCDERASYDPVASRQAWARLVDFFAEHIS